MEDVIQILKNPIFWAIAGVIATVLSVIIGGLTYIHMVRHDNRESKKKKAIKTTTVEKTVHIIESQKTQNSEHPYLVFICVKDINITNIGTAEFNLVFQNKGNSPVYTLKPKIKIQSLTKGDLMVINVNTTTAALVGETFEINCQFFDYEKTDVLKIETSLFFEDSSERSYKQTYEFDAIFGLDNCSISNYTKPVRI